jgi:hypothetical protein
MVAWQRENLATQTYACGSAPGIACSTAAFYFRDIGSAHAFMQAFPEVELADGT